MNGRGDSRCSALAPYEVERVQSSVDTFLRSFPLLDLETGIFKNLPRREMRRERAAYRLEKIEKQLAELELEQRLLIAELEKLEANR